MKVLFVALGIYSRIGGMERFNQRVVRCLAELTALIRECRVVILWDAPHHLRDQFPNLSFTTGASNKLKTMAAFTCHVRREQPDVIIYGHILLSPLAALARVLSQHSRSLLFVHGIEVWDDRSYRKIRPWEPWVVRSCIDRFISVSLFTEKRMKTAFHLSDSLFDILPNAVDVEIHDRPSQPTTRSLNNSFRLLTVARLTLRDRYKGCGQVIRALPNILVRFPNTQYYIVGDGPLKRELLILAEGMGVKEHVHFLGYLDDRELERVYALSNVFVMPSKTEGFGIVFLEAWKHGLPVITGNQDASVEVVTHGVNGLSVDPDSISEIGEAIIRLIREPEMGAQMGQKGFETVLQHYTHDHFLQNFARILKEATS
jgi:phosphatidyl-myo-inositol dimannoside synthase